MAVGSSSRGLCISKDLNPACVNLYPGKSLARSSSIVRGPQGMFGLPAFSVISRSLAMKSRVGPSGSHERGMPIGRKARYSLSTDSTGSHIPNPIQGTEVEVLPILRYQSGVDQIILVSRYCRIQEKQLIELPSGTSIPGEDAWDAASRLTHNLTGLCPSAFSRGVLSTPLSPWRRQVASQLVSVDVDAGRAMLERSGSTLTAPVGRAIHGVPLQGLREALLQYEEDGALVDRRLSYFAEGLELRYYRDQKAGMCDSAVLGRILGLLWMGASVCYACFVICGGLGVGVDVRGGVTPTMDWAQGPD